MNTNQILCAVRENRCLSSLTETVYSADTLPISVNTYPSAFICNTDPTPLPGKHWIVFWFQDSYHSECYDSLGQLPGTYNLHLIPFYRGIRSSVSTITNLYRKQGQTLADTTCCFTY